MISSDTEPSFKTLHKPNIEKIIKETLPKHPNYVNNVSMLNNNEDELQDMALWTPMVQKYIKEIENYTVEASNKKEIKHIQKKLVSFELKLADEFSDTATQNLLSMETTTTGSDDNLLLKAILLQLCTTVFELIKNDMVSNHSTVLCSIESSVCSIFSMTQTDIEKDYDAVENSRKMKEVIYYICGWLLQACKKASEHHHDALKEAMNEFYENCTTSKENATTSKLPTKKVLDSEQFGGLHFSSSKFYYFVCQLELVFIVNLSSEKLIIFGSSLIQTIHDALLGHSELYGNVAGLLPTNNYSHMIVQQLTHYLIKVYCRMRGNDYCRKMMEVNFRQENLTKPLRSELATLSQQRTYSARNKIENSDEKKESYEVFKSLSNEVANDQDLIEEIQLE